MGVAEAIIEEAQACLNALKCAYGHGFRSVIIEGDSLQLIQLLKSRSSTDSLINFFLKRHFSSSFELCFFIPFLLLKGEGIGLHMTLPSSDVPDAILARATDDIYLFINDNLI
uniref:RNase H type-1 domain-containing protein n=1 Tax=Opuntia streptacantha TaxID=393608 RepID=A0A7C8YGA3_OPUST